MLGAPVLMCGRGRGSQVTPTKILTAVHLDADVLDFFKSEGAGYQSRINAPLRTEVERHLTSLSVATTRERIPA